jgi:hypothetical protein
MPPLVARRAQISSPDRGIAMQIGALCVRGAAMASNRHAGKAVSPASGPPMIFGVGWNQSHAGSWQSLDAILDRRRAIDANLGQARAPAGSRDRSSSAASICDFRVSASTVRRGLGPVLTV